MWKYKSKKRDKYYSEVIRLRTQEGLGYLKISRIIPVGKSTIASWIRNFATENPKPTHMAKSESVQVSSSASENDNMGIEALQAEVKRLKKQLAQESLRADAYDELINVAEKQFNIQIRKKAGTKR